MSKESKVHLIYNVDSNSKYSEQSLIQSLDLLCITTEFELKLQIKATLN